MENKPAGTVPSISNAENLTKKNKEKKSTLWNACRDAKPYKHKLIYKDKIR